MSIGARYYKENKKKVTGADMLTGIMLALSYGKLPTNPVMYLYEDNEDYMLIDWDALGSLIDHLSGELGIEFKPLTIGSAKQYLHAMRKGFRANRNGTLPPLNVHLSEDDMMLRIPKRNFQLDFSKYSSELPTWVFSR